MEVVPKPLDLIHFYGTPHKLPTKKNCTWLYLLQCCPKLPRRSTRNPKVSKILAIILKVFFLYSPLPKRACGLGVFLYNDQLAATESTVQTCGFEQAIVDLCAVSTPNLGHGHARCARHYIVVTLSTGLTGAKIWWGSCSISYPSSPKTTIRNFRTIAGGKFSRVVAFPNN